MTESDTAAGDLDLDDEVPEELRARLCLALDTDDLVEARRWMRSVDAWFGVAKIGPELAVSAGPNAIAAMAEMDVEVFVDLKLHDIPSTVARTARVLGSLGVRYLTLHARGGVDMLRAGVEGAVAGADAAGLAPPTVLAVSVLTSDDGAPEHIHPGRVADAVAAGCRGVICAVDDIAPARAVAPDLFVAATGIRVDGIAGDDHRRTADPGAAFAAGADLLVLGRGILASDDPEGAAIAVFDSSLS